MTNKRGFTLFELVLGLAILMIMVPSLMAVFQQVLHTKAIAETRIISTNLAQMILEHESQKRHSAVVTLPAGSFGAGDAETNPYYDFDFTAYTYEVQVECLWHAASNGLEPNLDEWTVDAACSGLSAEYKRVTVSVSHGFSGTVRLRTLLTNSTDPGACVGRRAAAAGDCVAVDENFCPASAGISVCVPSACACPNFNDNGES